MSAHRRRRGPPAVGQAALTAGAVLGVLCLGGLLLCVVVGIRPLVVTSGSMSPAIPAGSLVLGRDTPADQVGVGDVVAVVSESGRVMHRVVAAEAVGSRTALTLQGDANATPDRKPYVVDRVLAVQVHLPVLGYAVAWLRTPPGLLGIGALACGLVMFAARRPPSVGRRKATAAVAVAATTTLLVGSAGPAAAWFDDTGAVTSGALVAHGVVSQAQPNCQNVDGLLVLGNIARVSWTQVDGRYEYAWELRNAASGTVVASGTVGTGQAQGQTVTLDIGTGLIGVNTDYNLVVRARLAATTTWVAPTATTTPLRRVSIIIIGAAFRCGHA